MLFFWDLILFMSSNKYRIWNKTYFVGPFNCTTPKLDCDGLTAVTTDPAKQVLFWRTQWGSISLISCSLEDANRPNLTKNNGFNNLWQWTNSQNNGFKQYEIWRPFLLYCIFWKFQVNYAISYTGHVFRMDKFLILYKIILSCVWVAGFVLVTRFIGFLQFVTTINSSTITI
jgi:hypothetical protein